MIVLACCKHSSIIANVASIGFVYIFISLCFSLFGVTLNKEVVAFAFIIVS